VIREVAAQVTLGDNKTKLAVKEIVSLELELPYEDCNTISAKIDLCVLKMPGRTIIVGLPDLTDTYFFVFIEALNKTRDENTEDKKRDQMRILRRGEEQANICLLDDTGTEWVYEPAEISPEELATPEPCSFTGPFSYLSVSHDQAIQEYERMLAEHISKK
jgi:hypothetical protein